jgi:dTDP-4-dehydrorhamnose 3,5-epimerase
VRTRELTVPGAWVLHPEHHEDERGLFLEAFSQDELLAVTGRPLPVAQVNTSVSRADVVRGVHFSDVPPGQAKYVTCVTGAILDVVVDVRIGSPTFGAVDTVRLDARSRSCVFLAEGLGHAFVALEPGSTVVYLCSTAYDPGREHAVSPNDPDLALPLPAAGTAVISSKDREAPTLREAAASGLLPRWEDCDRLPAPPGATGRTS